MRWFSLLLFLWVMVPRAFAAPTLEQLLDKVDKNLTYDTRESTLTMTVTRNDRAKVYQMHSYGRGATEAAIEYLAPERDKGTRMLRMGNDLWMYLPSVEKTQKISGHMLRQGMMGSDMSYEDMMEASSWRSNYGGTIDGEESYDGHPCWKLTLSAKSAELTYAKRVVWVDESTYIPLKQELYAVSGMLLKSWLMSDVKTVEGRQWPGKMVIEDKLQQGSRTELLFTDVKFSIPLQAEIFSTRWLER